MLLVYDIEAVNEEGLWVHSKFGFAVPRQNGKNEVVAIRELHGLTRGERILHTAHRTTTSTAAARRLASLLDAAGYQEVKRKSEDATYDKHYTYSKQLGLEQITLLGEGGGTISFRTRSAKGGLGESYDLLVIDEAQEYRDDEESALKYVIAASENPQTIFIGTPPTPVSGGTVFVKLRNDALSGDAEDVGWAEWSVDAMTDPKDREAWYLANPSMGTLLKERTVAAEIGSDQIDFNIQRLGLWLKYNQKSAISENEWNALKVERLPELVGKLYVGIKYAKDGEYVAMSIAVKTKEGKVFVESIDCRPIKAGNEWILDFLQKADIEDIVIDGQSGQNLLADEMKTNRLKKPILPTVAELIKANTGFWKTLNSNVICHAGQPSLTQSVSNCEKRAIGSNGGYGFKSNLEGVRVELLESVILALWRATEIKEKKKQIFGY